MQSVAIIGAGMAGITCATKLALDVPEVVVFERYAEAGGRMTSVSFGPFQCDLGAQYFTARDEAFIDHLQTWEDEWLIDEWNGWLVELENGQAMTRDDEVRRYIGRPGMDSVVKHLARMCQVEYNTTINALERKQGKWLLHDQAGKVHGPFDVVISAAPAPVAKRLLAASPRLARKISDVEMQASWVVVLGFDEPLNMGFDAANLIDSDITWMANNASKPGREGHEVWLLQVGNEWSHENRHLTPDQVIGHISREFNKATGNSIHKPAFVQAYLWEHSITINPLGCGYLYHDKLGLGACGDWCQYSRVEGAFRSGLLMAEAVLEQLETTDGYITTG